MLSGGSTVGPVEEHDIISSIKPVADPAPQTTTNVRLAIMVVGQRLQPDW